MLNFFGSSGKPKSSSSTASTPASSSSATSASNLPSRNDSSTSTSTAAAAPPKKKPRTGAVVVTTTRKLAKPPSLSNSASRDTIEAISGYRPINALSEEKRRRILEDRHAAELERRKTEESTRPITSKSISKKSLSTPRDRSKRSSRAASVSSDAPSSKGRARRKRTVASSDEDEEEDDADEFAGFSEKASRRGSRAPSTPRGSKRHSVDPSATVSDSYQKLGREGVAPSYAVQRDILAESEETSSSLQSQREDTNALIQSSHIVANSIKGFGPFFNGLGDAPKAVLEYPGAGCSEEYLLLTPRDRDEYDPLLELLSAVKAIVSNYLTPEQQKAFGSLGSLEVSSNAGMILHGSRINGSAMTAAQADPIGSNGPRARSADLLDVGSTKDERNDEWDLSSISHSGTPEPTTVPATSKVANGESHTAPVSPSSTGRIGHYANGSRSSAALPPLKMAVLSSAAANSGADSPVQPPASPPSSQGSTATAATTDPDPILRSLTKARNRRDGPLFLRTLARFNAELVRLKESGAIRTNIAELGRSRGVPEGVWRLIQDQVYARTVGPRVEELGRYQAFSDNVYGELLPRFMSEIAQLTALGPGKVFVDLGSGVGNLLIQTSLQTGCEAYGCEMMPVPAGLAERQIEEAKRRWKLWGLKGGPSVEAWKGDFGEHEKVRDILRRADVVLVNNYAFLPKTNENLSLLFLDLPDGASIVSLKPFVPPDFRLTERTLSSPLAILRVVERKYTSGCVSWADGGGKYYIQTVDRSLIRGFLQNGESSGGVERIRRKRWKARVDEDEDV